MANVGCHWGFFFHSIARSHCLLDEAAHCFPDLGDPAQRSCPISTGWTVPQLFPSPACEVWAPGAELCLQALKCFLYPAHSVNFFQYFIYFMLHVWFPPNLNTFSAAWVAPTYCCNVLEPHSKHSGCFRTSFLLIWCLKTICITMSKKQEVTLKSPLQSCKTCTTTYWFHLEFLWWCWIWSAKLPKNEYTRPCILFHVSWTLCCETESREKLLSVSLIHYLENPH